MHGIEPRPQLYQNCMRPPHSTSKDVFRVERKSKPSKGLMLSITPYVQVVHTGFAPMSFASEANVLD